MSGLDVTRLVGGASRPSMRAYIGAAAGVGIAGGIAGHYAGGKLDNKPAARTLETLDAPLTASAFAATAVTIGIAKVRGRSAMGAVAALGGATAALVGANIAGPDAPRRNPAPSGQIPEHPGPSSLVRGKGVDAPVWKTPTHRDLFLAGVGGVLGSALGLGLVGMVTENRWQGGRAPAAAAVLALGAGLTAYLGRNQSKEVERPVEGYPSHALTAEAYIPGDAPQAARDLEEQSFGTASVEVRWNDDDGDPRREIRNAPLSIGAIVGDREGYESRAKALEYLGYLTTELDGDAFVVYEVDDRFFVYRGGGDELSRVLAGVSNSSGGVVELADDAPLPAALVVDGELIRMERHPSDPNEARLIYEDHIGHGSSEGWIPSLLGEAVTDNGKVELRLGATHSQMFRTEAEAVGAMLEKAGDQAVFEQTGAWWLSDVEVPDLPENVYGMTVPRDGGDDEYAVQDTFAAMEVEGEVFVPHNGLWVTPSEIAYQ